MHIIAYLKKFCNKLLRESAEVQFDRIGEFVRVAWPTARGKEYPILQNQKRLYGGEQEW
ncbi:hypothetical protein [Moorena sp. SIO3B2]|uniref:hypothetical protein n=1 Tax=Moorena sp. SIO3B2 TaxID=2607827 RepID=UPI00257A40E3|nr:hypothetical protein [Moorena sp. SIO3B2]